MHPSTDGIEGSESISQPAACETVERIELLFGMETF